MNSVLLNTNIWNSPNFTELPEKRKLALLFVRTCDLANYSGVFPLPLIELEKAISSRRLNTIEILKTLPGIDYDFERQIVFARDHYRMMKILDPSSAHKIRAENELIATYLWRYFVNEYPETLSSINRYTEIPQPAAQVPSSSLSGCHINILRREKFQYAEYVTLSEEFYTELGRRGGPFRDRCIQKLSQYKRRSGRAYDNDEGPIRNWIMGVVEADIAREREEGGEKVQAAKMVWLRPQETKKLVEMFGKKKYDRLISSHDAYKSRKCLDVGNDYFALISLGEGKKGSDTSSPSGLPETQATGS